MNARLSDHQYANGWYRQGELLNEARVIHEAQRALRARRLERTRLLGLAAQPSSRPTSRVTARTGSAGWRHVAARVGTSLVALGRRLEAAECAAALKSHHPAH